MKSKILSPNLSQLVFDVYITPREFAEMVEKYDGKEMEVSINEDQASSAFKKQIEDCSEVENRINGLTGFTNGSSPDGKLLEVV